MVLHRIASAASLVTDQAAKVLKDAQIPMLFPHRPPVELLHARVFFFIIMLSALVTFFTCGLVQPSRRQYQTLPAASAQKPSVASSRSASPKYAGPGVPVRVVKKARPQPRKPSVQQIFPTQNKSTQAPSVACSKRTSPIASSDSVNNHSVRSEASQSGFHAQSASIYPVESGQHSRSTLTSHVQSAQSLTPASTLRSAASTEWTHRTLSCATLTSSGSLSRTVSSRRTVSSGSLTVTSLASSEVVYTYDEEPAAYTRCRAVDVLSTIYSADDASHCPSSRSTLKSSGKSSCQSTVRSNGATLKSHVSNMQPQSRSDRIAERVYAVQLQSESLAATTAALLRACGLTCIREDLDPMEALETQYAFTLASTSQVNLAGEEAQSTVSHSVCSTARLADLLREYGIESDMSLAELEAIYNYLASSAASTVRTTGSVEYDDGCF